MQNMKEENKKDCKFKNNTLDIISLEISDIVVEISTLEEDLMTEEVEVNLEVITKKIKIKIDLKHIVQKKKIDKVLN